MKNYLTSLKTRRCHPDLKPKDPLFEIEVVSSGETQAAAKKQAEEIAEGLGHNLEHFFGAKIVRELSDIESSELKVELNQLPLEVENDKAQQNDESKQEVSQEPSATIERIVSIVEGHPDYKNHGRLLSNSIAKNIETMFVPGDAFDFEKIAQDIASIDTLEALFDLELLSAILDGYPVKPKPSDVKYPMIWSAIESRLLRRACGTAPEAEIKLSYDHFEAQLDEQKPVVSQVCDKISELSHCRNLWHSISVCQMVMQCAKQDSQPESEPEPELKTKAMERLREKFSEPGPETLPAKGTIGDEYLAQLATLTASQKLVVLSLARIDDSHQQLTSEQFDEAFEKTQYVIDEYNELAPEKLFDLERTTENILNVDWGDGNAVIKTFLNIRTLRALFRENSEWKGRLDRENEADNEDKQDPKPVAAVSPSDANPSANDSELMDDFDGENPLEPTEFERQVSELNEKLEALEPGERLVLEDVSNDVYHAVIGDSSTKIKDSLVSLMYYDAKNNKKSLPERPTDHFDIGNLFHTLTLEPHKVGEEYIVEPDMKRPTEQQQKSYEKWISDGMQENQRLKPNDDVISECEKWLADGRPENQRLKPSSEIVSEVEQWIDDGKPENQRLKPAADILEKCQLFASSADNPAPTEKQIAAYEAWVAAGSPEPYAGKPTQSKIDKYDSWVAAGSPEPYSGKPTQSKIDKYEAWVAAGSPEPYSDKPSDICIERCAFWEEFNKKNASKIIIKKDDWRLAYHMSQAVLTDPDSAGIISHAATKFEVSYFMRDVETGGIVKCRTDIDLGSICGDLKSVSLRGNPNEEWLLHELRREVKRRNYHLSASQYLDITGKQQFVWIFVNKEPGYHWVAVLPASREILDAGYELYRGQLTKMAEAKKSGKWLKPKSIQKTYNPENKRFELPEI